METVGRQSAFARMRHYIGAGGLKVVKSTLPKNAALPACSRTLREKLNTLHGQIVMSQSACGGRPHIAEDQVAGSVMAERRFVLLFHDGEDGHST